MKTQTFSKALLSIIVLHLCYYAAHAQSVTGTVYTSDNLPAFYVHVYVKNTNIGTTTNAKGEYSLKLDEGNYEIVYSLLGYQTKIVAVIVYNKDIVKDVILEPSFVELEQVVIKANRRDPAYEIIQYAIEAKKDNYKQVQTSLCEVYIKAKEVISEKEKKKREKKEEPPSADNNKEGEPIVVEDPVQKQKKEQVDMANSMNMVEIKLERQYQYPDKVKEIRTAYEQYGTKEGLFSLSTTAADFNFYQNLLPVDNLNVTPLISPLNLTSVLSYKFALEKTWFEGDKMIYHIKVTPRKKGNSTFEGTIDIINGSYAIRRVDLSLFKGGLLFYDEFRVRQEYELMDYSVWVITRQEFDYHTKSGKTSFTGNTLVKYDNYKLNLEFPKKTFKNELAVTTQDAYERDSAYWVQIRPEPLSNEESKIIAIKDSIEAAHNKKEYLDSLDRSYNKVTWGDILLWGIGNYNRRKKQHLWFSSIPGTVNPFHIGGLRLGPIITYSKRFENEKSLFMFVYPHYGLRNEDLKGNFSVGLTYNPRKLATIKLNVGLDFAVVQPFESFAGYMDRANYVESTYSQLDHSIELFNGLYFDIAVSMKENRPITNYKFGDFSENFVPNNAPRPFEPYQLFTTAIEIKYVPFQKYMTEPKRKIILGSDWPEIGLTYKKGIPEIFGSDIDFDYLEASLKQTYNIGTLGASTYKIAGGKFLSARSMRYENYKIFPRSDKWFFSTPMQNQLQDTTFVTRKLYVEAHYVHHFNGSIINNIPFVKKLRMYEITGINYTWLKEDNYHYVDFYVGIEKSIRIQRQLFRLGVFFVYGGSSRQMARPSVQLSINHYDKSDRSWED